MALLICVLQRETPLISSRLCPFSLEKCIRIISLQTFSAIYKLIFLVFKKRLQFTFMKLGRLGSGMLLNNISVDSIYMQRLLGFFFMFRSELSRDSQISLLHPYSHAGIMCPHDCSKIIQIFTAVIFRKLQMIFGHASPCVYVCVFSKERFSHAIILAFSCCKMAVRYAFLSQTEL